MEDGLGDYDSETFFKKLCEADTTIHWELPELHRLCTQVTRLPSASLKEEIQRRGLPYRSGHFSPDEERIIKKNWKRLCKTFQLPKDPRSLATWRNVSRSRKADAARQFVVFWLSRNLPDRMPSQVYHRFLHGLGATKKGRFDEEEIDALKRYLKNDKRGQTQQQMAAMLGRDEKSIQREIKLLKDKGELHNPANATVKWTPKFIKSLLQTLILVLKGKNVTLTRQNIEFLKNRRIHHQEWSTVGKAMGVDHIKLQKQWSKKLYTQLFSPRPIYRRKTLVKVIKILERKGYSHWEDVDWKYVAGFFEGYTSHFVWFRFYKAAVENCSISYKNLTGVLQKLREMFIENRLGRRCRLCRIEIGENEELKFVK